MRTRTHLAAGAMLAVVLVLGTASAVAAQETTATTTVNVNNLSDQNKEIYECLEKQSQNATPDFISCYKANPIAPETNEWVSGLLAFLILLIAIRVFAWKGIKQGMNNRTERIRGDLARADEAKAEAEGVLADYQSRVAASKTEATRIIEDARAAADALKGELQKRAEAEIAETRQRAQADIEAAKQQAIADLRGEVTSLAIGAAEVVVQKNLDQATQIQLIENYINSVGSKS